MEVIVSSPSLSPLYLLTNVRYVIEPVKVNSIPIFKKGTTNLFSTTVRSLSRKMELYGTFPFPLSLY